MIEYNAVRIVELNKGRYDKESSDRRFGAIRLFGV